MDETTAMVLETARGLMGRASTAAVLRAAEAGSFAAPAWAAASEAGLLLAMAPEAAGGAGLGAASALQIARVAGETALPLPVGEAMLAAWLASRAGLAIPDGVWSLAASGTQDLPRLHGASLSGSAARVPWGRDATHMLVLAMQDRTPMLAWVRNTAWDITPGLSIAKEPRDTLRFLGPVEETAPSPVSPAMLRGCGAALRCQQIAGALGAITAMTTQYAQERSQFGRPIGRFQAVQQNLAVLAGQTAAAIAAADIAAEALDRAEDQALIAIAAAKTRAGEAAGIGAAIAHQVHGAIGFTIEHRLHFLTRRLWSWREEYGKEGEWAIHLGRHLAAQGADRLWAEIVAA